MVDKTFITNNNSGGAEAVGSYLLLASPLASKLRIIAFWGDYLNTWKFGFLRKVWQAMRWLLLGLSAASVSKYGLSISSFSFCWIRATKLRAIWTALWVAALECFPLTPWRFNTFWISWTARALSRHMYTSGSSDARLKKSDSDSTRRNFSFAISSIFIANVTVVSGEAVQFRGDISWVA